MQEENTDQTGTAEVVAEGSVKTPEIEATKKVETAAPVEDKTTETADSDDYSNVIAFLNEVQKIEGGTGDITDIPENMRSSLKLITKQIVGLRDSFKDPLFQDVLDDMVDQAEDGKTPSILVAIARNVPMEDLQDLADKENYEDVQGAVDERLTQQTSDMEADEKLYANFDTSNKAGNDYVAEMGYDEKEKEDLFATAAKLRDIFADGLIGKDEWKMIDEMRNYEKDMAGLQSQIPTEATKEVIPDNASLQESMEKTPVKPSVPAPRNAIEAMSAQPEVTDFTQVGRRKFTGR